MLKLKMGLLIFMAFVLASSSAWVVQAKPKAKRKILVERLVGKVVNNKGRGRLKDGSYINYKGWIKCKKGDRIETYLFYNPHSKFVDDVLYRVDYKIPRKGKKRKGE